MRSLEPLGGGEEGVLTEQLEGWWDQRGSVRERQDRTWEVDSGRGWGQVLGSGQS